MVDKMYGYKVGDIVTTRFTLYDEQEKEIKSGTKIRLVAIAPKVRIFLGDGQDNKQYFYNAVLAIQESDHGNRIRADFCSIRKIKKGE